MNFARMPSEYWWYRGVREQDNPKGNNDYIDYYMNNGERIMDNSPPEADIIYHINTLRGKYTHTPQEHIPLKFHWSDSFRILGNGLPKKDNNIYWILFQNRILKEFYIFLNHVRLIIEKENNFL